MLLGKLSLHELAFGVTTTNPHSGVTHNPHDPDRAPGGSSGGSGAATAAHPAAATIGTDTGGSIRIPASFCGCVGLQPTLGRVSTAGLMPLSRTFDTVGPLTRTVEDEAVVLSAAPTCRSCSPRPRSPAGSSRRRSRRTAPTRRRSVVSRSTSTCW